MHYVLAVLLAFGILTLWVPAQWPVAVFEIAVFSLTGWAVCRSHRKPPIFAYPLIPLGAAVAVGLFQLLTGGTIYAFETTQSVVRWLTFLCVFFVASIALRDERYLRWFRNAMLWFGAVIALVATLQTFTADGQIFWLFRVPYSEKAMGPILSYNHYGAFIEVLLPLAIYQALRRTDWPYLYAGMAATMYASVIACTSRAGTILSTVFVVVVVVLMYLRRMVAGRHAGVVLLRIASLLVLFTLVVGWQAVWNRLLQPDPMAFRRELDISSLRMIADHPWFGTGLGTWPVAYPKYAIVDAGVFANQAHCDWLQWAAEGGLPLFVLLAGLFVWALRSSLKGPYPCIWGLGIVSVFIHACVDYPFSRPALGSWFIVMLALLAASNALPRHSREESRESSFERPRHSDGY